MSFFRSILIAVLAILLSGCVSSRVPSEPPQTLNAVNRALADRWARIQLDDGTVIEGIESVRVAPDSTTYVDRYSREARTVATGDVRSVSIRKRGGGVGRGALFGAAPGLAVIGTGIVGGSGDASLNESLVAFTRVYIGAGLAIAGGIIGALIGGSATSPDWYPVYQGPVDSYNAAAYPVSPPRAWSATPFRN